MGLFFELQIITNLSTPTLENAKYFSTKAPLVSGAFTFNDYQSLSFIPINGTKKRDKRGTPRVGSHLLLFPCCSLKVRNDMRHSKKTRFSLYLSRFFRIKKSIKGYSWKNSLYHSCCLEHYFLKMPLKFLQPLWILAMYWYQKRSGFFRRFVAKRKCPLVNLNIYV